MILFLLACRATYDPGETPKDSGAPPYDSAAPGDSGDSGDSAEPCAESAWYADADGDGYGSSAVVYACEAPAGFVAEPGDCDDANSRVYPGAPVGCSGADNNCDGAADDADADGDHYLGCEECDDTDASVFPGASEYCDGVDDDCDGEVDEDAIDARERFEDGDGDGSGGASLGLSCDPVGVAEGGDCDDGDASAFPGATEYCDGIDDDCDGEVDEDAADATSWSIDYDGDGYGSAAYTTSACEAPAGWVASSDDCDDTDAAVSPGATEACNGLDDDCDGDTDEDSAVDAITWYLDADGDDHGVATSTTAACELPAGYAATDDDCDDGDGDVYPGARETCDGADENCDGIADDGALGSDSTCAAASCQAVLDDGSSTGDGLYWLDPDEDGDTSDAWEAYCDMTDDDGGWTLLYGSLWPYWWDSADWEDVGAPGDDNYSDLAERTDFADGSGTYTFRLEVGNADTWATGTRAHYTVWAQAHDPFTDSTDGSDYSYLEGDEPTTCSGFNGLHDQYRALGGTHCLSSDVDTGDSIGCWWMQIVPLQQYTDATSYPGYLEGYDGPNTHTWHTLWVR